MTDRDRKPERWAAVDAGPAAGWALTLVVGLVLAALFGLVDARCGMP